MTDKGVAIRLQDTQQGDVVLGTYTDQKLKITVEGEISHSSYFGWKYIVGADSVGSLELEAFEWRLLERQEDPRADLVARIMFQIPQKEWDNGTREEIKIKLRKRAAEALQELDRESNADTTET